MNIYLYKAALYCEQCGEAMKLALDNHGAIDTGDSDTYPQGPYADGGGEADSAQTCDACGVALDNPVIDPSGQILR